MLNNVAKINLLMGLLVVLLLISVAACGGDAEEEPVTEEVETATQEEPEIEEEEPAIEEESTDEEPVVEEETVVEVIPTEVATPDDFPCFTLAGTTAFQRSIEDLREIREASLPIVPSQIMITGRPEDIANLESDPRFQELGFSEPALNPPLQLPSIGDQEALVTNLYEFVDLNLSGDDVIAGIETIYNIALFDEGEAAREEPLVVFAQPNRLIGSPLGIDADPLGIDADPLGIDADPLGIDADPATGDPDKIRVPGEAIESVWNQWAFVAPSGIGIGLYDTSVSPPQRNQDMVGVYGEDVDVFIFDTSPFSQSEEADVMGRQLCVNHPDLVVDITSADSQVKQHGYFVAGLIRFVAPNGRFHLIRNLNEEGVGEVFSFIVLLHNLMEERVSMEHSVINLSMSLHDFDDEDKAELELDASTQATLTAALPAEYASFVANVDVVPALELILWQAHSEGAVIIAASGNNSNMTTTGQDFFTAVPAIFGTTVGVAGSNVDGTRSCFSNKVEAETVCHRTPGMDVANCAADEGLQAPAGNGINGVNSCDYPFPEPPPPPTCPASSFGGGYDCIYGLSSVVISDTGDVGYAHWLGTSFAAPLVSGTAALMLEASAGNCDQFTISNWLHNLNGVLDVPTAVSAAQNGC